MRKLAPLLCAVALTLSLAVPAGAYYASNEDGSNEPGGPITSVSVTTEPVVEPTLPSLGGLTPDGNLALIDDILGGAYYSSEEVGDSQMQFVTVESKAARFAAPTSTNVPARNLNPRPSRPRLLLLSRRRTAAASTPLRSCPSSS